MQPPFPNESETVIQQVLSQYALTAHTVVPVRSWNTSVYCVVAEQGRFALRFHREGVRSEAHIRGELAFLKHLAEAGLAVPRPCYHLGNDTVFVFEFAGTVRCCDVITWFDGEVRRQGLKGHDAYKLGLLLAQIHKASSVFILPAQAKLPDYTSTYLVREMANFAELLESWLGPDNLTFVSRVVHQIEELFAQWRGVELTQGVIHNDFILGNCLWYKGSLRIVDFAGCGLGFYLYDFAVMLTNIGDDAILREHFIRGYASVRMLDQQHSLPLLEAARHIKVCLWALTKAQRGDRGPDLKRLLEARMSQLRELIASGKILL